MTKLEELKAALEAATPGEWETNQDVDITSGVKFVATALYPDSEVATQIEYNNADFIALAHNMMPQLLEAARLLEVMRLNQYEYDGEWCLPEEHANLIPEIDHVLEKLR